MVTNAGKTPAKASVQEATAVEEKAPVAEKKPAKRTTTKK